MAKAGVDTGSERLTGAALGVRRTAESCVDLAVALWEAGDDRAAGQTMAHAAEVLPDDEVLLAMVRLRERGRAGEGLDLCLAAAVVRPARSTAAFARALDEWGLPLDSYRLLDEAGRQRLLAELVALLDTLHSEGGYAHAERVAAAASQPRARWLADVSARSVSTADLAHLAELFDWLSRLPLANIEDVTSALCDQGRPALAAKFVETIVGRRPGEVAALGEKLFRRGDDAGRLLASLATGQHSPAARAAIVRQLESAKDRPWQEAKDHWLNADVDSAQRSLTQLIEDPNPEARATALLIQGVILRDVYGDLPGAEATLSQVIDIGTEPAASVARLHRGYIAEGAGNLDAAVADYRVVARSADADCASLSRLYLAWARQDGGHDVRATLRQARDAARDTTRDWQTLALGEAELRARRPDAARSRFEEAAQSTSEEVCGHAAYQLFLLALQDGVHTEAATLASAVLSTPEAVDLYPFVLQHERPRTSEGRRRAVSLWLTWLHVHLDATVHLVDDANPDRRVIVSSTSDGLTVDVLHRAGRRFRRSGLSAGEVEALAEVAFVDVTGSGKDEHRMRAAVNELDDDAVAELCDRVLTDVFGAPAGFPLGVRWPDGEEPQAPQPRPGTPTLIP
jgi:hypothetical protein